MDSDLFPPDIEDQFLQFLESHPRFRSEPRTLALGAATFGDPACLARFEQLKEPRPTSDTRSTSDSSDRSRLRMAEAREYLQLLHRLNDARLRRESSAAMARAIDRLASFNTDPKAVLTEVMGSLRKSLQETVHASRPGTPLEAVIRAVDHHEHCLRQHWMDRTGITPFAGLNRILDEFLPGRVYLFVGPPAVGKSVLAVQLATHLAGPAGIPVAMFSSHLGHDHLINAALAAGACCPLPGMEAGIREAGDIDNFTDVARWLTKDRIEFLSGADVNFADLEALLECAPAEHPRRVLVVDGVTAPMLGADYTERGLNRALAGLRRIGRERGVAVLVFVGLRDDEDGEGWKADDHFPANRLPIAGEGGLDADMVAEFWEIGTDDAAAGDGSDTPFEFSPPLCLLNVCRNAFGILEAVLLELNPIRCSFRELTEASETSSQPGNDSD